MSRPAGRPRGTANRQSLSYLAAVYCIEYGVSERIAAERFDITPASVHNAKNRHFPGVRYPRAPFPEDECSW